MILISANKIKDNNLEERSRETHLSFILMNVFYTIIIIYCLLVRYTLSAMRFILFFFYIFFYYFWSFQFLRSDGFCSPDPFFYIFRSIPTVTRVWFCLCSIHRLLRLWEASMILFTKSYPVFSLQAGECQMTAYQYL